MAAFPSLSNSVSLSSRASKLSASAMSVIAATMTSNAQVGTLGSDAKFYGTFYTYVQSTYHLCMCLYHETRLLLVGL